MKGCILISAIMASAFLVACGTSPKEHAQAAYQQYSQQCVARGLTENSPQFNDCVADKYLAIRRSQSEVTENMERYFRTNQEQASTAGNSGAATDWENDGEQKVD